MKTKLIPIIVTLVVSIASLLSSCSGNGGGKVSEITSVEYNAEELSIEISVTLSSADMREFRGETVYLMEIPPNSTLDDIATLVPISQSRLAGEMTFKLPLKNGALTYLYSGFVPAVFDRTNGYIPLCECKYVENPDAIAKNKDPYPEYPSIKGLSVASSSDAVKLGVKHTVIRIPIEDYIIAETNVGDREAITKVFDGVSHYYDAKKVGELDYKIKNLSDAGIEVILEFTLDSLPSSLPSSMVSLGSYTGSAPNGDGSDNHYAISVNDGNSYRHLASLFEFFAERYTGYRDKYGFAASYIIGRGVNSLSETNVADPATLADTAESYGALLRIASSALRSKYAEGRVFVSLNNIWNIPDDNEESEAIGDEGDSLTPSAPAPSPLRTEFGGAEFLNELDRAINAGGKFDYGIALMPTASDGSSRVWTDIGSSSTPDSQYLTMRNLDAAKEYTEGRELIIYNYGISSADESAMAASYAYAYLMAEKAGVDAFIYKGHIDGLADAGDCGLMTVSEDGNLVSKRSIYNAFKNIDVVGAPEPGEAKALIGGEWNSLWEEYGSSVKSASVSESDGSTALKKNDKKLKKAKTSQLFDFRGGDSFGFYPSDSASYLEISEFLGERVLKSGLHPKFKGERMGVRSAPISVDLFENVIQIEAVIFTDAGEGNTGYTELALVQSSEKGSSIHVSRAAIQTGNRQRVYFDIRDAKLDKELGDVTLYLWVESSNGRSSIYNNDIDGEEALSLFIEGFTLYTYKSSLGVVLTVIGIIVAAAIIAAAAYLFFIRRSQPPTSPSRTTGGKGPSKRPKSGRNEGIGGRRPEGTARPQRPSQNPGHSGTKTQHTGAGAGTQSRRMYTDTGMRAQPQRTQTNTDMRAQPQRTQTSTGLQRASQDDRYNTRNYTPVRRDGTQSAGRNTRDPKNRR